MNRNYLQSILEKCYLSGLISSTRLKVSNKNIKLNFTNESKTFIGSVESSDFDLKDCEIGLYDLSQFLKLINILDNLIEVTTFEKNGIIQKLLIADNVYDLEYPLANISIIPKAGELNIEPNYNVEFNIDKELISKFLRGYKALKPETLIIEPDTNELKFLLGESGDFSNKVNFKTASKNSSIPGSPLHFNANIIAEIFNNNSESEIGKGLIDESEGLMKFEFQYQNIKSTYLIAAKMA